MYEQGLGNIWITGFPAHPLATCDHPPVNNFVISYDADPLLPTMFDNDGSSVVSHAGEIAVACVPDDTSHLLDTGGLPRQSL